MQAWTNDYLELEKETGFWFRMSHKIKPIKELRSRVLSSRVWYEHATHNVVWNILWGWRSQSLVVCHLWPLATVFSLLNWKNNDIDQWVGFKIFQLIFSYTRGQLNKNVWLMNVYTTEHSSWFLNSWHCVLEYQMVYVSTLKQQVLLSLLLLLTLQLVFEEPIYLYDWFYRLFLCIYCEPSGIYQSNVASLSTCLYT